MVVVDGGFAPGLAVELWPRLADWFVDSGAYVAFDKRVVVLIKEVVDVVVVVVP